MLSFFRTNKYSTETVNSAYYNRECIVHSAEDLSLILHPDQKEFTLVTDTDKELLIKNLPLIELNEQYIVASLKKPVYVLDNSKSIKGHKVLFYKEDVGFYRFLLQFHLIDDKFFFANNRVTSSGMLPETEKNKIIHQILNRYLIKTGEEYNDFQIMLTDKNGSVLTTIDDVNFDVNYLCGGDIKNNLMDRFSDQINPKAKKTEFEDNVDKFF